MTVVKKRLEKTQRLAESAMDAQRQERALALARGEVKVPQRCGFCRSSSLEVGDRFERLDAVCVSCGRRTPIEMVRRLRRQEIRAYIEDGAT